MTSSTDILIEEWNLDANLRSKEEILAALVARIMDMLMHNPSGFIQIMYRLDIPEAALEAALVDPNAASLVAGLVWDRQLQKVMLRSSMPQRRSDAGDDDLAW